METVMTTLSPATRTGQASELSAHLRAASAALRAAIHSAVRDHVPLSPRRLDSLLNVVARIESLRAGVENDAVAVAERRAS
jgi:hypothetical protein